MQNDDDRRMLEHGANLIQRVALDAHAGPDKTQGRGALRLEDGGGQQAGTASIEDAEMCEAEEDSNA